MSKLCTGIMTKNNVSQGWKALHFLAKAESLGEISEREIIDKTNNLFAQGVDLHQTDELGNTAFNIAAPSSPILGRLMTNHWLKLALSGKGKGLNERSGSHNSSLSQYIAKWSNAEEIEEQLDTAIKGGMKIAEQNASGWTPLHAACAMLDRLHAVRAFATRYSKKELALTTTEAYETSYAGFPEIIKYEIGLTAEDVALARLNQGKSLPEAKKQEFREYYLYLTTQILNS
jgi:hypothetical protein